MKRFYGIVTLICTALLSLSLLVNCGGGGGGGGSSGGNGAGNANIVSTTLSLSMTGIAAGTRIGSLDISVSYPDSKVTFTSLAAGTLTTSAIMLHKDDTSTHVVRIGLIDAAGFDGGAAGSVAVVTFAVTSGSTPASADFSITRVIATDLSGVTLAGIDQNKMVFTLQNQ